MADEISLDPNPISNPLGGPAGSGGAANFDILSIFEQFGYYPTQAEIQAIAPSFSGRINPLQIGTSAVAQYVQQKQASDQAMANDPLAALQTEMTNSANLMKNQVAGLYTQLQSTLTAAPQLFGNLTPDQITTYLAPLQTAFTQQLSQVQAVMASRGLGASSTEANALAQTNEQFQQNVFSTGLGVGVQSQQAKAKSISDQINALLGLTGTEETLSTEAAKQRSSQNLSQSNLVASLPTFLNQLSAQSPQGVPEPSGFQSTFNQVTGDIQQGFNAAIPIFSSATSAANSLSNRSPQTPSNPSGQVPTYPSFGPQMPLGPNLPGGAPSADAALFA